MDDGVWQWRVTKNWIASRFVGFGGWTTDGWRRIWPSPKIDTVSLVAPGSS